MNAPELNVFNVYAFREVSVEVLRPSSSDGLRMTSKKRRPHDKKAVRL